jgi:hypothetical protein
VDNVKELYRTPGLVRLQMTYEMPLGASASYSNDLGFAFLNLIFAENIYARVDRLAHNNSRMRFAYSHKLDLIGVAADTPGRVSYSEPNLR